MTVALYLDPKTFERIAFSREPISTSFTLVLHADKQDKLKGLYPARHKGNLHFVLFDDCTVLPELLEHLRERFSNLLISRTETFLS